MALAWHLGFFQPGGQFLRESILRANVPRAPGGSCRPFMTQSQKSYSVGESRDTPRGGTWMLLLHGRDEKVTLLGDALGFSRETEPTDV